MRVGQVKTIKVREDKHRGGKYGAGREVSETIGEVRKTR
jgi:hypothetical protein